MLKISSYGCVTFVFTFFFTNIIGNLSQDVPQEIRLYHDLKGSLKSDWELFGYVFLENINSGLISFNQSEKGALLHEKLTELALKDHLYRLLAIVKTNKGKEDFFFTYTNANLLIGGDISLILKMYVDASGTIVGFSVFPVQTNITIEKKPIIASFIIDKIDQGPVPDTASYIQKLEREREAKQAGAVQDNRSFFAKYWIYLLPIVLFAILSGSSNTEAGQNAR